MATITLEIPIEMARLVCDVVNAAADNGERAFTDDPTLFTVTQAETDATVAELRHFTALIEARFAEHDRKLVSEPRDPRMLEANERTLYVLSPVVNVCGATWSLKGARGFDSGGMADNAMAAVHKAFKAATDRGLRIVEVHSDLNAIKYEAALYKVPFHLTSAVR